jgi:hypothetical protein
MTLPITTKGTGICFAFPDVCNTPIGTGTAPVPYPNIGQLTEAENVAESVLVGGEAVVTKNSRIQTTTGDEAGSAGPGPKGEVTFVTASETVFAEDHPVVRLGDTTRQNGQNAVGQVLGGNPTVVAG